MTYDECRALMLAEDPPALERRLRSAAKRLKVPNCEQGRFEFKNKRLICGPWQLVWRIRRQPDEPPSATNPQSPSGFVEVLAA